MNLSVPDRIAWVAVVSVIILLAQPWATAQKQEEKQSSTPPTQHAQDAMSSGGAHAAVLDNEKRPITAGGFVDSGPVVFEDVAEKAGLTAWRHVMGTDELRFIIETIGSGVAIIDYDNDGWPDIYLVNGSTYDAIAGQGHASACRSLSQQS